MSSMQSETWQKGSTGSLETSGGSGGSRSGLPAQPSGNIKSEYPFAFALRLRVVQIVCGIGTVVMGSVAAIEERGQFNLSLGVPAGAVTVLAAGWSVHRSIQGGGDSGGSKGCRWCARLLCVLAYTLQATLLVLALRSLLHRHHFGENHTSNTSVGVAAAQGVLAACALSAATFSARIRLLHGPAPGALPSRNTRYPRSTSHTAVSMVPMASNYFATSTNNEITINKNNDSENDMMEVSIGDLKQNSDSSPIEERKKTEGAKVTIANNNLIAKVNSPCHTNSAENIVANGTEKNTI